VVLVVVAIAIAIAIAIGGPIARARWERHH